MEQKFPQAECMEFQSCPLMLSLQSVLKKIERATIAPTRVLMNLLRIRWIYRMLITLTNTFNRIILGVLKVYASKVNTCRGRYSLVLRRCSEHDLLLLFVTA
jgi:hypothetical protein